MTKKHTEAAKTFMRIAISIIETVEETQPAPESAIHLALQSSLNFSHAQCADFIDTMVGLGMLTRDGSSLLRVGDFSVEVG